MLARWVALALLAGGAAALLGYVDHLRRHPIDAVAVAPLPAASETGAGRPWMPFLSSAECGACHKAIHAEWKASPHSRPWGTHPMIPKDPLRIECSPCHIPARIYELGLDAQIMIRPDRHHEGVDCVACHVKEGESLGPGPTRAAPCNPRHEPTIRLNITCKPCHDLHGTLEEWKTSRFSKEPNLQTCQDCHMPEVERPLVEGQAPRKGRSHTILGGRDLELVRKALTMGVRIDGDALEVTLTNDRTGHAVPGEINNRQLTLAIKLKAWGEPAIDHQRRFQAPPRPKRGLVPSTQIFPDQTVRERRPLPGIGGVGALRMEYRLLYLMPPTHVYGRHHIWWFDALGWRRTRIVKLPPLGR